MHEAGWLSGSIYINVPKTSGKQARIRISTYKKIFSTQKVDRADLRPLKRQKVVEIEVENCSHISKSTENMHENAKN